MYLHIGLTEFFLNCRCLPFISHGKQSNESTWRRMSLPCRNPYKCKRVACSVVVTCLLVISAFFILHFVYFLIPLFYTDAVVAMFLFIRWSCQQAHYLCFWSFYFSFQEYNFNFHKNISCSIIQLYPDLRSQLSWIRTRPNWVKLERIQRTFQCRKLIRKFRQTSDSVSSPFLQFREIQPSPGTHII